MQVTAFYTCLDSGVRKHGGVATMSSSVSDAGEAHGHGNVVHCCAWSMHTHTRHHDKRTPFVLLKVDCKSRKQSQVRGTRCYCMDLTLTTFDAHLYLLVTI